MRINISEKRCGMKGEDRILEYLAGCDTPQDPQSIALAINRSYGYTRNLLSKMVKEGKVRKVARGLYVHPDAVNVNPKLTMRPLKLHGLKIMTKRREGHTFMTTEEFIKIAPYKPFEHRINHALYYDEVWRERVITVTYHPEHTIIIDLKSSKKPLNFEEFNAFIGWLEGRFPKIPVGWWELVQVGLNWDIIGMYLDGIESITLEVFKQIWFRMYMKSRDMLRIEAHTNIKLGLSEAIEALQGALDSVEKAAYRKIVVIKNER